MISKSLISSELKNTENEISECECMLKSTLTTCILFIYAFFFPFSSYFSVCIRDFCRLLCIEVIHL